jgi:hypothetical protein
VCGCERAPRTSVRALLPPPPVIGGLPPCACFCVVGTHQCGFPCGVRDWRLAVSCTPCRVRRVVLVGFKLGRATNTTQKLNRSWDCAPPVEVAACAACAAALASGLETRYLRGWCLSWVVERAVAHSARPLVRPSPPFKQLHGPVSHRRAASGGAPTVDGCRAPAGAAVTAFPSLLQLCLFPRWRARGRTISPVPRPPSHTPYPSSPRTPYPLPGSRPRAMCAPA